MKSEHRHELKENLLVKEIEHWSDRLKPYGSLIAMTLFAAIVLFAAASWWNSYQATKEASAWEAYQMASLEGDSELKAMDRAAKSEDYLGSRMQEWAHMAWADRQLRLSAEYFLVRREDAKERLDSVRSIYQQIAETGSEADLRNRAQLGLARVFEMQNRFDDARAAYGKVKGSLAKLASERSNLLDSKQAQEISTWLASADIPLPPAPGGPGTPGKRPNFGVETPQGDPAPDKTEGESSASPSIEEILGGSNGDDAASDDVRTKAANNDDSPSAPQDSDAGK